MGTPASLFHARLTLHGRAREKSVAARVAYVGATNAKDDYSKITHDNRSKPGVLRFGIFGFLGSVQELVTQIDAAEKRRDSNTCREVVVGLPCGLEERQRWDILARIVKALCARWKVAGVVALHSPNKKGDLRNDHGHVVFSPREYVGGKFGAKTRQLDVLPRGRDEVGWLREMVSLEICRVLRSVGREKECALWDHRSYVARGIEKRPGKHDGPVRRRIIRERKLEESSLLF